MHIKVVCVRSIIERLKEAFQDRVLKVGVRFLVKFLFCKYEGKSVPARMLELALNASQKRS